MAGFKDEIVYGANVDFTGAAVPTAQMTADADLLFGSTVAPAIRKGQLVQPAAGITLAFSTPTSTTAALTMALADDLAAIEGLATTGIAVRTAASAWATRSLTQPAAGITISNSDGVAGNPTFALANDLAALEGLATTGIAVRTASDTWATRSLTQPAAGITISNSDGTAGNPTFALADDLAAVEGLATNGMVARTASNTWTTRTITAGVGIAMTNGDGVSGNPTVAITGGLVLISSQSASNSASITFTGLSTYNQYKLYIHKAQPVTNAQVLRIDISQDNGSSWINTGYTAGVLYSAYNSTTQTAANSTTIMPISGPCSNGDSYTAELYMGSVNQPDYFTLNGLATWNDTTLATTAGGTVRGRGTTGVNAIRLTFASGNINTGSFTLFGIKTA